MILLIFFGVTVQVNSLIFTSVHVRFCTLSFIPLAMATRSTTVWKELVVLNIGSSKGVARYMYETRLDLVVIVVITVSRAIASSDHDGADGYMLDASFISTSFTYIHGHAKSKPKSKSKSTPPYPRIKDQQPAPHSPTAHSPQTSSPH
jgi:hypothetical protein